jgi:hypothetical protein
VASALSVRQQLACTQAALFDAREALLTLRGEYPLRPGRFARLRAAIHRHQAARVAYTAAALAFHASPQGERLQQLRRHYIG